MHYVTTIIYYNEDSGLRLSTTAQIGLIFPAYADEDDDECVYSIDELMINIYTRVVRKIRFPRSCSREERCYMGSGDTGV
jgi:hypothetical protein